MSTQPTIIENLHSPPASAEEAATIANEFSEYIPLPNPPTAQFVENAFNSLVRSMMAKLNGFVTEGNPAIVTGVAVGVRSTPQGFRMMSKVQYVRADAKERNVAGITAELSKSFEAVTP